MTSKSLAEPRRIPTGTTVRFLLLIAAVTATGAIIFGFAYTHIPGKLDLMLRAYRGCDNDFQTASAALGPINSFENYESQNAARQNLQRCLFAANADQAAFVGYGLALLFTLALGIYLLHPMRIRRRAGLKRLSAADLPGLLSYLDGLCHDLGLKRVPHWFWAPRAGTMGGQVFGLPGRRCIRLDAGLLIQYTANRNAFRAVVLHELAHLRNRDVDITYYTLAVWRAFVGLALVPAAALMVNPLLFTPPAGWHWRAIGPISATGETLYRFASLAALACLVYITRNAILRVREFHADAAAAAHDGPISGMPAVLERLSPRRRPRWLHGWGWHPDPIKRRETIANSRLLLRGGHWELVEAGALGGMLCASMGFLLGPFVQLDPLTGNAIIAAFGWPVMVGMLAVVVWRRTAAHPLPDGRIGERLIPPTCLIGGFLLGSVASFSGVDETLAGRLAVGNLSHLLDVLVLFVLLALATIWIQSVARTLTAYRSHAAWAGPAAIATAAFAAMAWFPAWFAYTGIDSAWQPQFGDPPKSGADIIWYRVLAEWTSLDFGPLFRIYHNPLVPTAITLLWLIPIATTLRTDALRMCMRAGFIGGLAVVIAGSTLPFAALAALPADVRVNPDEPEVGASPFALVYFFTFIAFAVLVQAVVAGTVAACATELRPALVLLATNICAVVSTLAIFCVVNPITCEINLLNQTPAPTQCVRLPDGTFVGMVSHWILVKGVLLSSIAAASVTAVRAILCRSARGPVDSSANLRFGFVSTVLGTVVIANLTLAAIGLPYAYDVWLSKILG